MDNSAQTGASASQIGSSSGQSTNSPSQGITFEDVFPGSNVKMILSGSELLLMFYLDKYSIKYLGRPFDTARYKVHPKLLDCSAMAFCRKNAFLTNLTLPFSAEKEQAWMRRQRWASFYNGDSSYVEPAQIDDTAVIYSFINATATNQAIRQARSTGYIDLLAYVLVRNFEQKKRRTLIINNLEASPVNLEYTDLRILRDLGNKLINKDVVSFLYRSVLGNQPEFYAYLEYNRQRGGMMRSYTAKEKYTYAKSNNFDVGDVFLLYEMKGNSASSGTIRSDRAINSCAIGVVRHMDDRGITFDVIASPDTHLSRIKSVEAAMQRSKYKTYTEIDKHSFYVLNRRFSWFDIGVGTCFFSENYFFIPPFEEDGSTQWLSTGVKDCEVQLDTIDTCYAVLVDREVEFNREKFLRLYYQKRGKLPAYDAVTAKFEEYCRAGVCHPPRKGAVRCRENCLVAR